MLNPNWPPVLIIFTTSRSLKETPVDGCSLIGEISEIGLELSTESNGIIISIIPISFFNCLLISSGKNEQKNKTCRKMLMITYSPRKLDL